MSDDTARHHFLAAIDEAVREAEASVLLGNVGGVEGLIDVANALVDEGRTFAMEAPVQALERLRTAQKLSDAQVATTLNLRGLLMRGDLASATETFRQALILAEASGDRLVIATTVLNLGVTTWMSGDLDQAVDLFTKGLAMRDRSDRYGRAQVHINLVGVHFDRGDDAKARAVLNRLQRSQVVRSNARLHAAVLGLRGLASVRQGDTVEAERYLLLSLKAARVAGAIDHELTALQNLAAVNIDLGRVGKALRRLRQAERLAKVVESYRVLDAVQRTLATALQAAGRSADALRVLDAAACNARERGDVATWGKSLTDLGSLHLIRGRPAEATVVLRTALGGLLEGQERDWSIKAVSALAMALISDGHLTKAVEVTHSVVVQLELAATERASLFEHLGDLMLEHDEGELATDAYSEVARELGDLPEAPADRLASMATKLAPVVPERAIQFFTAALDAPRSEQAEISSDQILNDRALARVAAGELQAAKEDLQSALPVADARGDRAMLTNLLANLSEVSRRTGETEGAATYATQALRQARHLGPGPRAVALGARGLAQLDLGQIAAARKSFNRALKLARHDKDSSSEAVALGGLAACDFVDRLYASAVERWEAAAVLERASGDVVHETETVGALLEVAATRRDHEATDQHLQRLVDLVQTADGPLDVAETAIRRAGRMWIVAREVAAAADVLVIGSVLAAAESPKSDDQSLVTAMLRPLIAGFVDAKLEFPDGLASLERAYAKSLRRHLGQSAKAIIEMLPEARAAAVSAPRQDG